MTTQNYQSEHGYHRHKCYFCGFVWEHRDENDKHHGNSGAHECPGCSRCNWSLGIYEGGESPKIRHGVVPDAPIENV